MTHNARRLKDSIPINIVYMNHQSMESISDSFSEHSRDDIHKMLISGKRFSLGSCTESCEVFGDQMDMFKEIK